MNETRRSLLAGGASLAWTALPASPAESVSQRLLRGSEAGNAALLRGDLAAYRQHIDVADDFVLRSPFGGAPSFARDLTPERWESVARFFQGGTLRQETVACFASSELIVLAVVEDCEAAVGGLP